MLFHDTVTLVFTLVLSSCICAVSGAPAQTSGLQAVYAVLSGASIDISNASPGSKLATALEPFKKAAGIQGVYYGKEIENPNNLDVIAIFKSSSNAVACQSVVNKQSIVKLTLITGITPVPPSLETAGETEITTFYKIPNANQTTVNNFNAAFANLRQAVVSAKGNVYAVSGDIAGKLRNPQGQDTAAVLAFVGWQNHAAHDAFQQTPQFGQAIGGIIPYISGTATVNVPLKKFL